jgi:DNA mismatch endonuclease, patch repair protein
MSLIRGKNTKPELLVRSLLHRLGYRFRLHRSDLPGSPDIILPKYQVAIFVNGCFWHFHKKCINGKIPQTNVKYWHEKLIKNVERDKKNIAKLKRNGWRVLVVWECQAKKDVGKLSNRIMRFMNKD